MNLAQYGIQLTGTLPHEVDIVVPLSGGKDSQACLKGAVATGRRVLALFCDTQFEHPWTYHHVGRVVRAYGVPLVKLTAGSVPEKVRQYRVWPGHGGARNCTQELKIRPTKFFLKELGRPVEVWYGMRLGESERRRRKYHVFDQGERYLPHEIIPRKYPKYLAAMGVRFVLPILNWTTEEVFSYLGDLVNPLYAAGFPRVGCFPCLAGGERFQQQAFTFDAFGRKQLATVSQLAHELGRPIFLSKNLQGCNPGCAVCSI